MVMSQSRVEKELDTILHCHLGANLGLGLSFSILIFPHFYKVPGVMGSQLQVMDQTSSKLCSTGRKYKELWISLLRVTVYNICAKKELP